MAKQIEITLRRAQQRGENEVSRIQNTSTGNMRDEIKFYNKNQTFVKEKTLESGFELGLQIQGHETARETQDQGSTFYVS